MAKPTHSVQNEGASHRDEGTALGFERIVFFSDAVIAIAITLLVLDAGAAAGMGLSLAGVWLYAARHRFVSAEASPALMKQVRTYLLLPPLMFIASAVLALFNAEAAVFAWLLLVPIYVYRRYSERGVDV